MIFKTIVANPKSSEKKIISFGAEKCFQENVTKRNKTFKKIMLHLT